MAQQQHAPPVPLAIEGMMWCVYVYITSFVDCWLTIVFTHSFTALLRHPQNRAA